MTLEAAFPFEIPYLSGFQVEPDKKSCEGGKEEEIYPPRYDPGDGWQGNLQFALKHEGVNLEVLSALFRELPIDEFTRWIKTAPLSRYVRIAWFLHEWFGGEKIKVRDLTQGNYLPVLDESRFYAITERAEQSSVRRQRIINNLPGSPGYCPTIRRTASLSKFEAKRLDFQGKAQAIQGAGRFGIGQDGKDCPGGDGQSFRRGRDLGGFRGIRL